MAGITSAVKMVEQYGRGPDTMLAHISPDEAALIDHLQGGRRTNPTTGLAEYGLFGKILKGVVRAAAGIGGFMVGGPAGAAAASAAATKLTGGNWKQSLLAGGLSGVGAGLGNMASGTGFMGTTGLGGAAANSVPLSQLGARAAETVLPTGLAGSIGSMAAPIGGLGGLGAAGGALLGQPREGGGMPEGFGESPPHPDANITYNPLAPVRREYNPYTGDYSKYGEAGGEHNFYRPVNVPGLGMARGGAVRGYAEGGEVTLGSFDRTKNYLGFQEMIKDLSAQIEALPPRSPERAMLIEQLMALTGDRKEYLSQPYIEGANPGGNTPRIMRNEMGNYAKGGRAHRAVARSGISQAARMGTVRGPGDGQSDNVPAMLSDNEHVIDAGTVALAGNGSSDAGHRVIEKFKRDIRAKAGLKKPSAPPKRVRAAHG